MHLNKYAIFRYILIGFIIIFALACGAYYSIPFFLENKLLTIIAKSYGFTESSCEVRKLSLNKLDIASLKLGQLIINTEKTFKKPIVRTAIENLKAEMEQKLG